MKRSTKLLCLLLSVITLLGMLAACGGNETPTTGSQKPSVNTTTATPSQGTTTSVVTDCFPNTTDPNVITPPSTVTDVVTTTPPATTPPTTTPTTTVNGGSSEVTTLFPVVTNPVDDRPTDANGYILDNIPYDEIDYSDPVEGAHKFRALVCEAFAQWTFPKEQGGQNNPMQTAAYYRNIEIEEKLGIYFQLNIVPGHSDYQSQWMTAATTAVGEGCELICGYSRWMAIHAQSEYLLNMYNYTYPELDMPWYPTQMNEWSQYNCLFFVSGTCTTRTTAEGHVIFADLNMLNDMNLEDPMAIVVAGDWTVSKLGEYTAAFHDLSVSTSSNPDTMIYGIYASSPYAFYYSMGNRYTQLSSRGKQELACISESALQRASDCVEELLAVLNTTEAIAKPGLNIAQTMSTHRAAFVVGGMLNITWVTDNETPYAALPMPKRDINQEDYLTITTYAYEVFGIPTSSADPEMSAVTLEACFSSDYREMAPLFFEKNMKGRYTNSSIGAAIYDIIRYSRVIDFGNISRMNGTGPEDAWNQCFNGERMENTYVVYMNNTVNYQNVLRTELNNLLTVYRKHGST